MGLFKADPPAPPDYTKLAAVSEKQAQQAYELSKQQQEWAQKTYGENAALTKQVVDKMMASQDMQQQWSQEDRARYKSVYQPLEDQLAAEAQSFSTPARQQYEANRDMASVSTQFEGAREAATRQLESFGVDPTSTRAQALDIGTRQAEAAAKAAAGNNAVARVDAQGRALRSEAINVGRGYPGQAAAAAAGANQAGTGAVGNNLGTTQSGASTMGTGAQWAGIGNNAINTWGNVLNTGYNNQLASYNAGQQASSGWGSALGMIGGSLAGNPLLFAAEGGDVPTEGIPLRPTPGGHVPFESSPSSGHAIDDVPAQLTAGEFVIPRDVKEWKGEEYFHKLIAGARKKQSEPQQAQPQMGA